LGAPLNKKQCMSNWNLRPLSVEQLKYAALDAFVLLKIFDDLEKRCETLGINFNNLKIKKKNLNKKVKPVC
jgi:ribonuclease D